MEYLTMQSFKEKICNLDVDGEGNSVWEYKGSRPAVIDFYADWCGPCKALSPILDEVAKEYDGIVDIYKIDTEAEPELAGMFGISSIPSLLFVPVGAQPQMAQGAIPKQAFAQAFKDIFNIEK